MLKDLLYPNRRYKFNTPHGKMLDEFASDRSRIVFSTSFRKMMQKAQVFSMEKNTS
jgi:dGTPase